MNSVQLIGRLTADPELKHTQSGTACVRFTIAVDRAYSKKDEERQADFISCVAWDKRAEMISRYFSKGDRIGVAGEIRTGSYTDRDGNKRYTFDVWVNGVDFCNGGKGTQQQEPKSNSKPESKSQEYDQMTPANDEDLPF